MEYQCFCPSELDRQKSHGLGPSEKSRQHDAPGGYRFHERKTTIVLLGNRTERGLRTT